MKATRRVLGAVPILLATAIALSCNNSFGVFQSIQGEQKQTGTSVFQEVAVSKVFRLGGFYYAVISSLQRTAVGSDSWSKVAIGGTTSYTLRDAALVGGSIGGTMYALIETGTTGVTSGPSKFTVLVYSSTDGTTWSPVTLPAQSYSGSLIENLDALFVTSDGQLYAEDHSYDPNANDPNNAGASTYKLYLLGGGGTTLTTAVSFTPASTNRSIRGVVYDGTNYWFASEDRIFRGTLPDGSNATDASAALPGVLSSSSIWSISYTGGSLAGSPGGFVYVTTQNGWVYRSDGTNNNPTSFPLTQVIEVPSANVPGTTLLVGSDTIISTSAVGYFEGNWPSFSNGGSPNYDVAGGQSIYTTTVSSFPVHSFYYDALTGALFICVSPGNTNNIYHGLYRSTWSGTGWSYWLAQ